MRKHHPPGCLEHRPPARTAILQHWFAIPGVAKEIAAERPAPDQADLVAAGRTLATVDYRADVVAAERTLAAAEAFGAASEKEVRLRAHTLTAAKQEVSATARAIAAAAAARASEPAVRASETAASTFKAAASASKHAVRSAPPAREIIPQARVALRAARAYSATKTRRSAAAGVPPESLPLPRAAATPAPGEDIQPQKHTGYVGVDYS